MKSRERWRRRRRTCREGVEKEYRKEECDRARSSINVCNVVAAFSRGLGLEKLAVVCHLGDEANNHQRFRPRLAA